MKKFKHYFIYKTTNLLNGKIYIGKRRTNRDDLDPNYLGSGVHLQNSINYYGRDNFTRELLYYVNDDELLNFLEIETIAYYKRIFNENCYNIHEGGKGGDTMEYASDADRQKRFLKMSALKKGNTNTKGITVKTESKEKRKETLKNNPDIMINSIKKCKQYYLNNPDLKINEINKFKETLKNNPDIIINSMNKRKETYLNNPEIVIATQIKRRIFYAKKRLETNNYPKYSPFSHESDLEFLKQNNIDINNISY